MNAIVLKTTISAARLNMHKSIKFMIIIMIDLIYIRLIIKFYF